MPEQIVNKFHVAPVWLNRDYVEKKLRVYFKDAKLELEQLQIQPATANGENYASVMTRINVEYKDKDLVHHNATFLVKTTFADKDPAAHLLEPYGIYVREINMYEEVLPKLAEILRQEMGDPRKLFAATINVDRERDSIMFEDMSLKKYYVADRIKQLDRQQTQLVLEKLAVFHALAALLNEKQPGIFAKKYDRCFFNQHTRGYQPIMQNMVKALIRSLEDDEELHQRYAGKLKGVVEHIMEYCERAMETKKNDFVTLCHGDLWTTNMMFKNNDHGKPDNVLFIDFQFSVWSSPAIDLQYFFHTSLQDDICHTEMVHFYHQKLVQALNKLKFKGRIPTLFDFQQQYQSRAFYAIFAGFCFLPSMLHSGKEEFSIARAMSHSKIDADFRAKLYKTEIMRSKLKKFLPKFDHKGLLDDM
ncbi:uncharacterized protein LOC117790723 [Drosophila innubila]|uniref:uncharacterized protein LOC117790723 n=1 Tax=Drosophila innubila TaxID=198719 RepID=UPI00148C3C5F|nr:uncharacterized protein LOC117790723 [Drosophila innubila]